MNEAAVANTYFGIWESSPQRDLPPIPVMNNLDSKAVIKLKPKMGPQLCARTCNNTIAADGTATRPGLVRAPNPLD